MNFSFNEAKGKPTRSLFASPNFKDQMISKGEGSLFGGESILTGGGKITSSSEPGQLNQTFAGFGTELDDREAGKNSIFGGSEGKRCDTQDDPSFGSFFTSTQLPNPRKLPNVDMACPEVLIESSPTKDFTFNDQKFEGNSTNVDYKDVKLNSTNNLENVKTEKFEIIGQEDTKNKPQGSGLHASVVKAAGGGGRLSGVGEGDSLMQLLDAQKQGLIFQLGSVVEESSQRRQDMVASLEQVSREGEGYRRQLQGVKEQYKSKLGQLASFFGANK